MEEEILKSPAEFLEDYGIEFCTFYPNDGKELGS